MVKVEGLLDLVVRDCYCSSIRSCSYLPLVMSMFPVVVPFPTFPPTLDPVQDQ